MVNIGWVHRKKLRFYHILHDSAPQKLCCFQKTWGFYQPNGVDLGKVVTCWCPCWWSIATYNSKHQICSGWISLHIWLNWLGPLGHINGDGDGTLGTFTGFLQLLALVDLGVLERSSESERITAWSICHLSPEYFGYLEENHTELWVCESLELVDIDCGLTSWEKSCWISGSCLFQKSDVVPLQQGSRGRRSEFFGVKFEA